MLISPVACWVQVPDMAGPHWTVNGRDLAMVVRPQQCLSCMPKHPPADGAVIGARSPCQFVYQPRPHTDGDTLQGQGHSQALQGGNPKAAAAAHLDDQTAVNHNGGKS